MPLFISILFVVTLTAFFLGKVFGLIEATRKGYVLLPVLFFLFLGLAIGRYHSIWALGYEWSKVWGIWGFAAVGYLLGAVWRRLSVRSREVDMTPYDEPIAVLDARASLRPWQER